MSDTPMTDAVRDTPLMGEAVTPHKWDKMTKLARKLERDLAAAQQEIERLRQSIPPDMVMVPRALLWRIWGFLAQDCTPCAAEDCQIDGKNIGVEQLVNEINAALRGEGKGEK